MVDAKVNRVPVVDEAGHLAGTLTRDDVVAAVVRADSIR